MTTLDRSSNIGFIGAGVVGGTLAVALSTQGYRVAAVASRTYSSAQALAAMIDGCEPYPMFQDVADGADAVFITTPDDAIVSVAAAVAWHHGQAVMHTSGVASVDALKHASQGGALAGAFHPMQAFSSVETGPRSIPSTTFGIEGSPRLQTFLEELAIALGGRPMVVRPEDKPLYHVSGAMMGYLLTTLTATAAQLWEALGYSRDDGVNALVPMMRQVSANLESQGVPGAVAGPAVRGDVGTVRKHLEALRARAPHLLPLYRELTLAGLPFAAEKGPALPGAIDEIRKLMEDTG